MKPIYYHLCIILGIFLMVFSSLSLSYHFGFSAGQKSGTITISDDSFLGCSGGAGLMKGFVFDNVQVIDKRTAGNCEPKILATSTSWAEQQCCVDGKQKCIGWLDEAGAHSSCPAPEILATSTAK